MKGKRNDQHILVLANGESLEADPFEDVGTAI